MIRAMMPTDEDTDSDKRLSMVDEALVAAKDGDGPIDELLDMPMLASVLESGLAAFDLSCDGIGDLS